MDDKLRKVALAVLAGLIEEAEQDGPAYIGHEGSAPETYEGFHANLREVRGHLERAIAHEGGWPNARYDRSFALAAKLVMLADADPAAFAVFAGAADSFSSSAAGRVSCASEIYRALMDDHDFVLVRTQRGPAIRRQGAETANVALVGISEAEAAVTDHFGGDGAFRIELETHPAFETEPELRP